MCAPPPNGSKLILCGAEELTVGPESQRRGGAQDPGVGGRVLHQADVTPHVGRLHLGDVKVPRVLGNEAAAVLSNERGELVKHPAVGDLWRDEAGDGESVQAWLWMLPETHRGNSD